MKILLVEDEKRMAQALVEILRLEKYEVDHCADGFSGLDAMESNVYDIIILDVMLPGMDGFEIVRNARKKGIRTPVLMLTAKSELDDGIRGNLIFLMADKGGYTLVAFMDNTIMQGSMATLFRYTLVFGGVVIILFFFLAVYLAKGIVKPLEESYRRQKQFISDAGHELKTPVSVVSVNAELLAREIGSNRWLSNIQYENERMGALVTQLLELARTENVSPQMECVDLSRLAAGETLPFESVAFENGVILESDIEDDVQVSGNSIQLKQLISILLDNAIRHCQDGGAVGLALGKEKNTAFLSVVNDGEEIPKDQRKKIFERFYRADQARNSESGNYGLGLAIAKAIVTVHRGRIEVLCHDGKVEFAVRIPLQKQ